MEWEGRVQRDDRGFTLVELVVSLTVLAIGIVAVVGVMNTSLTMVSTTSGRTRAVALATRELEGFRAVPYDNLEPGTTSEQEKFGGRGFNITKDVKWIARGSKLKAYKQGDVTITWTDSSGSHTIKQSTILYPGGLGKYNGAEDESGGAATTTDPPPAPTAITATAVATDPATEIDVAWVPGVGTVEVKTWALEYTLDGMTWIRVTDTLPKEITAYRTEGLSPDTVYTFRVAAISPDGIRSAWSSLASLRTAAVATTGCSIGTTSITPSASKRTSGNASAGIQDNPVIALNSNGGCSGLRIVYAPKSGVTRTLLLATATSLTWTATVNGTNDAWDIGTKELFIEDANANRYGSILFQVCAHNARSCP